MTAPCPLDLPNPVQELVVVPLAETPVTGNVTTSGNGDGAGRGHGSDPVGSGGMDTISWIGIVVGIVLVAMVVGWAAWMFEQRDRGVPLINFDGMFRWIGDRVGAR